MFSLCASESFSSAGGEEFFSSRTWMGKPSVPTGVQLVADWNQQRHKSEDSVGVRESELSHSWVSFPASRSFSVSSLHDLPVCGGPCLWGRGALVAPDGPPLWMGA